MNKKYSKFEILVSVIAIIAVFPFIINSVYNHNSIDDFIYAYRFFDTSIWDTIIDVYLTWSGRYFGTFISIINPLLYKSHALSVFYSIVVIVFFIFSIYYVLHSFYSPKTSKITIAGLTSLLIIAFLSQCPDVYAFFYWFSGYITYSISAFLSLIVIGVVYKYFQNILTLPTTLLILIPALFIIAGSNEFSLLHLHGIAIMSIICIPQYRHTNKFYLFYAILFAFSIIFLVAPGNFVRAKICNTDVTMGKALYISLYYTKEFFVRFFPLFLSVGFVYLTVFAHKVHSKHSKLITVNPILVVALFIGILVALQFFSLYTTFTPLLYRTENSTLLFSLLAWLVILQLLYSKISDSIYITRIATSTYVKALSIVVLLVISLLPSSPIMVSYKDLVLGESCKYHSIRNIQEEILYSSHGKSCVVIPALQSYPETLLPKRSEKQASITKLLYDFGSNLYFNIDTISVHNDTVKRHKTIRLKDFEE